MANLSDNSRKPQATNGGLTEAQRRLHFGEPGRDYGPLPDYWHDAGVELGQRLDRYGPKPTRYEWLNYIAIDPDNLGLVLQDMGFEKCVAVYDRAERADFPNPDWTVFAMQIAADQPSVWIDVGSGRWRMADASRRGPHLISLGEMMWNVRHGEAAKRIALACGYPEVPRYGH